MAAALLQMTVPTRFEVLGALPNLVLVAVFVSASMLGARTGMVLACAGGLLLDLASAGPIGPHALALLPGAYLAGLWPRRLQAVNVPVGTLLYASVLLIVYQPPIDSAARIAVAAAVYNSALALLVFVLVRVLSLGTISRRAQA